MNKPYVISKPPSSLSAGRKNVGRSIYCLRRFVARLKPTQHLVIVGTKNTQSSPRPPAAVMKESRQWKNTQPDRSVPLRWQKLLAGHNLNQRPSSSEFFTFQPHDTTERTGVLLLIRGIQFKSRAGKQFSSSSVPSYRCTAAPQITHHCGTFHAATCTSVCAECHKIRRFAV